MKAHYDFSDGERGKFYLGNSKVTLPTKPVLQEWTGVRGSLAQIIVEESNNALDLYEIQPQLITEHADIERNSAESAQALLLIKLLHSSADAVRNSREGTSILFRLTEHHLYCADNGVPIDEKGVRSLSYIHAHGPADSEENLRGRFGFGFMSVLSVTDAPEIYSRSGSFRFGREAAKLTNPAVEKNDRYPALSLPEPIDPHSAMESDDELGELMSWANNVIRLPLKAGVHEALSREIRKLPVRWMLIANDIRFITFEDGEYSRDFVIPKPQGGSHFDFSELIANVKSFSSKLKAHNENKNDHPLSEDQLEDLTFCLLVFLDQSYGSGLFWPTLPIEDTTPSKGKWKRLVRYIEKQPNRLPRVYIHQLIDICFVQMPADFIPHLEKHIIKIYERFGLLIPAVEMGFAAGQRAHMKSAAHGHSLETDVKFEFNPFNLLGLVSEMP